MVSDVILGAIIGGLFTLLATIIQKYGIQFYPSQRRFAGTWKGKGVEIGRLGTSGTRKSLTYEFDLELKQRGRHITGKVFGRRSDGVSFIDKISGHVDDTNYISTSFRSTKVQEAVFGVAFLALDTDGLKMSGGLHPKIWTSS